MSRAAPSTADLLPPGRGIRRIAVALAGVLALAALAPGEAGAWELRRDAPAEAFSAFHARFASAAYPYPRHGADPLGITGFRLYADLSAEQELDGEPFFSAAVDGSLPADTLSIARVGVRKGLPAGIDVGVSYGRAVDSDIELASAELQWAIINGGALKPALSVRLTGTQTVGGDVYDLETYGAELMLSKGFAVLTPFVGAGVYRAEGTLDRGAGLGSTGADDNGTVLYAGATLNLVLPKLTLELEQGDSFQAAFRVAFGF